MWQKYPPTNSMSWADALAYCENLGLAEYTDWRMPNAKELQSILNYSLNNPAIDAAFFPNFLPTQPYNDQWYWTSTIHDRVFDHARVINIYRGGVDALRYEGPTFVWAVRTGQGGVPTTTTIIQPSSTTTSSVTSSSSSITSSTTTSSSSGGGGGGGGTPVTTSIAVVTTIAPQTTTTTVQANTTTTTAAITTTTTTALTECQIKSIQPTGIQIGFGLLPRIRRFTLTMNTDLEALGITCADLNIQNAPRGAYIISCAVVGETIEATILFWGIQPGTYNINLGQGQCGSIPFVVTRF
jgi:hypothetical protein